MSQQNNLVQGIELRDAAGQSLGVYRSEEVVKAMVAERDDVRKQLAELKARLGTMEKATGDLVVQRDLMSAELALIRKERDEFQKAVHFLTQTEFAFTQENIAEAEKNGLDFDRVIGKLEKLVQGASDG